MMKCPVCGSDNVTPSHLRGLERIFRFLYPRTPYRCKECWSRFWTGSSKGSAIKIAVGIAILLLAIFFILPIDQLFKKNKDDQPPKTVSKAIEKPKADKSDKVSPKKIAKDADDDADESESPKIAKNTGTGFKTEDISETPAKSDKHSAKSDKPARDDKSKAVKDKTTKPAVSEMKKTEAGDDIPDAEHQAAPQIPESPKLKEPSVEIPKPSKQVKKAEPKSKTVLSEPEVRQEPETADKESEKPAPVSAASERKIKAIKAAVADNSVEIAVSADGPIKAYNHFFLFKEVPPKLVVDVRGKWKYAGKPAFDVNSDLMSKVRVAEHNEKGFFRIVMDLKTKEGMTPVIRESAEGLVITVKK